MTPSDSNSESIWSSSSNRCLSSALLDQFATESVDDGYSNEFDRIAGDGSGEALDFENEGEPVDYEDKNMPLLYPTNATIIPITEHGCLPVILESKSEWQCGEE